MRSLRIVIVGLALAVTLSVQAGEPGWYFGGGLGQVDYGSMKRELNFLIAAPVGEQGSGTIGATVVTVVQIGTGPSFAADDALDVDDSDVGWGATVGYRILDYVAVELSYLDLGTLLTREVLALPLIPPDTLEVKQALRTNGAAISILGILPVGERWDAFVRAGLLTADQELTVSSSDSALIPSVQLSNEKRSNTALWGAGVQYNWASWSVRLDFQRYSGMEFADIDLLGLSVLYHL